MGGRMTDHEPTALDKLDQISDEIHQLAVLAEETGNEPALQEFARLLAKVDQTKAWIREVADDHDVCEALETEFPPPH